jgi:hypothetical protein
MGKAEEALQAARNKYVERGGVLDGAGEPAARPPAEMEVDAEELDKDISETEKLLETKRKQKDDMQDSKRRKMELETEKAKLDELAKAAGAAAASQG